jgi:hypothetical protein
MSLIEDASTKFAITPFLNSNKFFCSEDLKGRTDLGKSTTLRISLPHHMSLIEQASMTFAITSFLNSNEFFRSEHLNERTDLGKSTTLSISLPHHMSLIEDASTKFAITPFLNSNKLFCSEDLKERTNLDTSMTLSISLPHHMSLNAHASARFGHTFPSLISEGEESFLSTKWIDMDGSMNVSNSLLSESHFVLAEPVTESRESAEKLTLSPGAWVGIALAILVFVILALLATWYLVRKRVFSEEETRDPNLGTEMGTDSDDGFDAELEDEFTKHSFEQSESASDAGHLSTELIKMATSSSNAEETLW